VEVMWLLGRLAPDYKSIAEFRRMHREAATEAGAALVGFARSAGLVRGEWIAIDGSKFQAAGSARGVREREAVKRYLEQLEQADEGDEMVIDPDAVATALEKLNRHAGLCGLSGRFYRGLIDFRKLEHLLGLFDGGRCASDGLGDADEATDQRGVVGQHALG
jgi:hypothetical protein